jgi:proline racemase
MPTLIYKFSSKEQLDETLGHLLPRIGGIKILSVPSADHKISIECRDSEQVDEIRSLLKSFNEKKNLDIKTNRLVKILGETAVGEGRMMRLINGDLIRLIPSNARSIIQVHDQLSEENQYALRAMIIESKKTHEAAIQFCLENTKETD